MFMKYIWILFLAFPYFSFGQTFSTYDTPLINQCIDGRVTVNKILPQPFNCLGSSCLTCTNSADLDYSILKTGGSVSSALDLYTPKYNRIPFSYKFERESPFPYHDACGSFDFDNDSTAIQNITFDDCYSVNPHGSRHCNEINLWIEFDFKNKQVRNINIHYEELSVTVNGKEQEYHAKYPYGYRKGKMVDGKHVTYFHHQNGQLSTEFVGVNRPSKKKRLKYYILLKELYHSDFREWSMKNYWKDVFKDKNFVDMLGGNLNKEEFEMIFYQYDDNKLTEIFKCSYNEREMGELPVFENITFTYDENNNLENFKRLTRYSKVNKDDNYPEDRHINISFFYDHLNRLTEKHYSDPSDVVFLVEKYNFNSSRLISSFTQDNYTTKNDSTYIWNTNTFQIKYNIED